MRLVLKIVAVTVWLLGVAVFGGLLGSALSGSGSAALWAILLVVWLVGGVQVLKPILPAWWTRSLIRRDRPSPR